MPWRTRLYGQPICRQAGVEASLCGCTAHLGINNHVHVRGLPTFRTSVFVEFVEMIITGNGGTSVQLGHITTCMSHTYS